ncbi:chemotaxis protein CheR [Uliginosibacterium sp. TH139]|nr:chemotaxis protein CheR [Uliginosibacterium sp. TH139]
MTSVTTAENSADLLFSEREFTFTEPDFQRVCALIYARAGISLSASKQDLVYGRLARRLRALGIRSFAHYLDQLDEPQAPEWEHFTNALTTNLTAFFREKHHFEMLAEHLRQHAGHGPLRVWSAAASTGEEAYSIAITVAQNLHRASDEVKILATDIDTSVLDKGRAGIYPAERIDSLPAELCAHYFQRGQGAHAGQVRVVERLRSMIAFKRLNLLAESWPMRHKFDVVFLRNVLIYFDKSTQATLIEHLSRYIKPGGLLFIGHSESPHVDRRVFESIGRTAYRVLEDARHG